MRKKIVNFITGLFEFTKMLTIAFTAFYFYSMDFTLKLAAISVEKNYLGSLAFLTAAIGAINAAAAIFFNSVVKKSQAENLNKHPLPETSRQVDEGGNG